MGYFYANYKICYDLVVFLMLSWVFHPSHMSIDNVMDIWLWCKREVFSRVSLFSDRFVIDIFLDIMGAFDKAWLACNFVFLVIHLLGYPVCYDWELLCQVFVAIVIHSNYSKFLSCLFCWFYNRIHASSVSLFCFLIFCVCFGFSHFYYKNKFIMH